MLGWKFGRKCGRKTGCVRVLWRLWWWPLSDSHASNPACPGSETVPCNSDRQYDKPDDEPLTRSSDELRGGVTGDLKDEDCGVKRRFQEQVNARVVS